MKRITVEQITNAYETTGLEPINNEFVSILEDQTACACALSALYVQQQEGEVFEHVTKLIEVLYDLPDNKEPVFILAEALGLDLKYAIGFVGGFDGGRFHNFFGEHRALGYADGKAARHELLAKGGGLE